MPEDLTDKFNELYIQRSEYIVTGFMAILVLLIVIIWIAVLNNMRRNGIFSESQVLEIQVIIAVICTVGLGVFLWFWVRGKPQGM